MSMYNVDTISLGVSFRRYLENENTKKADGKEHKKVDWDYVVRMNKKIKAKLYMNNENEENRKRERHKRIAEVRDAIDKIVHKKVKEKSIYWNGKCGKYNFCYNETWDYLNIMLEHELVENSTADEIMENTRNVIMEYFEISEEDMNGIVLTRIDIKADYRYKDTKELELIKNIIDKSKDKLRTYVKEVVQDDEDGYTVNFIARGGVDEETGEEKAGSRYMEVTVYEKGKQMLDKLKKGKTTEAEAKKYENVIRVELKIKNGKLNKNKFEDGVSKELVNYYNDDFTREYFNNYIQQIFGKNDFYRIDVAVGVIKQCKKFKQKKIQQLCELLKLVNKYGYTKAEQLWIAKYSIGTLYTDMKRIDDIGINILTFDKKVNGNKVEVDKINNFALL